MQEPTNQPLGWKPPVAAGDERLTCTYCDWSCPRWYQNQTGPKAPEPGRDGHTRLAAHIDTEHYIQHKKAKKAARDRRRYAEKKAQQ
jgi:hypothetical protein